MRTKQRLWYVQGEQSLCRSRIKQVENFRYLGSVIHAKGGSEEDMKARIAAAWKKWKELSGVLCD